MRTASLLRILVLVASALWAAITIYQEFIDVDASQYGITSPEAKQRMENCTGNYQQRSACKEQILDEEQRSEFIPYLQKAAIVMVPPIALWYLVSRATRERAPKPEQPSAPRRRPAAGQPPPRRRMTPPPRV